MRCLSMTLCHRPLPTINQLGLRNMFLKLLLTFVFPFPKALVVYTFFTFLAFTPTLKLHFFILSLFTSNMHSHKSLALLALAASTASPALSAPLRENHQQARASAAPAAAGGIGSILKTIATGVGFGALPVVLQDLLGGSSTRRALTRDVLEDLIYRGIPVSVNGDGLDSPPTTNPALLFFDGLPVGLNKRFVASGEDIASLLGLKATSASSDALPVTLQDLLIGSSGPSTRRSLLEGSPPTSTDTNHLPPPLSNGNLKRDLGAQIGTLSDILNSLQPTDFLGNNGVLDGTVPGTKRALDDRDLSDLLDSIKSKVTDFLGNFPDGLLPSTVPGTKRALDDRDLSDLLNSIKSKVTDFLGNLPDGLLPSTVPGTKRALDDRDLSDLLNSIKSKVTDFLGNLPDGLLPSTVPGTKRALDDRDLSDLLNSIKSKVTDFLGNLPDGLLPSTVPGTKRALDDRDLSELLNSIKSKVTDFLGNLPDGLLPSTVPGTKRALDVRDLSDLLDSFKSEVTDSDFLGNGVLPGGVAGTRRDPSPLSASDLRGIGKTIAGTLASLAAATGVNELLTRGDLQDVVDSLRFLSRPIDALD